MTHDMDWQEACVLLWGEDFVAPLSEVLDVNRRTVSRWKTGVVEIPERIERMIVECSPRPMMTRQLGDVLRAAANGADENDLRRDISDRAAAVRRYLSMRRSSALGQLINVLSLERSGRLPASPNENEADEE